MVGEDWRTLLSQMFWAAVDAARPAKILPLHMPAKPNGRTIVIGAGKASAEMARVFEQNWDGPCEGLVVTRYGHGAPCEKIEIMEAGHPVPDEAGERAARKMLDAVSTLSADDLVVALISGGGSALLAAPKAPLTLQDERAINVNLLKSGATISEINCIRRHLSAIKGGRLAGAAFPARLVALAISDAPGDRPEDIASGPTVSDPTTCQEALSIVRRLNLLLPQAAIDLLESGAGESLKLDDPRLRRASYRLIATPERSLEAAAQIGEAAGFAVHILSDRMEGEARETGKVLGALAVRCAERGSPFRPPCILLSGGETSVTVRGKGCGGRNVEFLLSLALTLQGAEHVYALAADTDGVDGGAEIAGAFLDPSTLSRARRQNFSAREKLADNDGHGFFSGLGDSFITGPTRTNINDFRAILICERK